jgi:hypothetical protein
MVAPWAVTSAAHRDGLPVLGSQRCSRLRPRNDMGTPVMLTLIGGRWQRRGATWWHLGLGITSSTGGFNTPLAKATSGAAPGGFGGPP